MSAQLTQHDLPMDSYTFDLHRIFFGDQPPVYLLEILFRTSILFVFTLALLRWVGHRGMSQLSVAEFTLIIALGSAVGDPMFYPEVPLLHGMTVVLVIIVLQRFLTTLTIHHRFFSFMIDGTAHRVVVDGVLDLQGIKATRLTSSEIFAELRQAGAEHLGQIRRAYLEPDGQVSVILYPETEVKPGLSLLWDGDTPSENILAARSKAPSGHYACYNCGHVRQHSGGTLPHCSRCKGKEWAEAVTQTENSEADSTESVPT